jgi:hypothetical protein
LVLLFSVMQSASILLSLQRDLKGLTAQFVHWGLGCVRCTQKNDQNQRGISAGELVSMEEGPKWVVACGLQ